MNKKGLMGILISILLMVIFIALPVFLSYSSIDEKTITIKDKERIQDSSSSYYLIFTEGAVYKNEDSFLQWKFDSSDVYNNLDIGKTYNVKVNWYRVPFLSMYKNIIEIK